MPSPVQGQDHCKRSGRSRVWVRARQDGSTAAANSKQDTVMRRRDKGQVQNKDRSSGTGQGQ